MFWIPKFSWENTPPALLPTFLRGYSDFDLDNLSSPRFLLSVSLHLLNFRFPFLAVYLHIQMSYLPSFRSACFVLFLFLFSLNCFAIPCLPFAMILSFASNFLLFCNSNTTMIHFACHLPFQSILFLLIDSPHFLPSNHSVFSSCLLPSILSSFLVSRYLFVLPSFLVVSPLYSISVVVSPLVLL